MSGYYYNYSVGLAVASIRLQGRLQVLREGNRGTIFFTILVTLENGFENRKNLLHIGHTSLRLMCRRAQQIFVPRAPFSVNTPLHGGQYILLLCMFYTLLC